MDTNELKPCTFCGEKAVCFNMLDNKLRGARYFGCMKRCVVSFTGMTEAEAIEALDTRAEGGNDAD